MPLLKKDDGLAFNTAPPGGSTIKHTLCPPVPPVSHVKEPAKKLNPASVEIPGITPVVEAAPTVHPSAPVGAFITPAPD